MFLTRQSPDVRSGEAPIIEGRRRRWYHLRPKPRRPTDLWGFNSTWWMVLAWPLLIAFAVSPWPWW
jgi:hypothetical protein